MPRLGQGERPPATIATTADAEHGGDSQPKTFPSETANTASVTAA